MCRELTTELAPSCVADELCNVRVQRGTCVCNVRTSVRVERRVRERDWWHHAWLVHGWTESVTGASEDMVAESQSESAAVHPIRMHAAFKAPTHPHALRTPFVMGP